MLYHLNIIGGQLLYTAGIVNCLTEAYNMIRKTLHNGTAASKFCAMLKAQGVDPKVADRLCEKGNDVFEVLQKSKFTTELKSPKTGTKWMSLL